METSSGIASALPPLVSILATTVSSASLRRPETTTAQPSAASASAPASPMPLPPPVTQATRLPLFDMPTVSIAFQRALLLLNCCRGKKAAPPRGMMHQWAAEDDHERQPVLPPVRR